MRLVDFHNNTVLPQLQNRLHDKAVELKSAFAGWLRKIFALSMDYPNLNWLRLGTSIHVGKIVPMKSSVLHELRRSLILFSLAFLQASSVSAQVMSAIPTADAQQRTLTRTWIGALEYRDDRSEEKSNLPMPTRIDIGADGATVTRVSAFDDGPKKR